MNDFTFKLTKTIHRKEQVLCIHFPMNGKASLALKKISGLRWSQTMRCWYLPFSIEAKAMVISTLEEFGLVNESSTIKAISNETSEKISAPLELSPETVLRITELKRWMRSKRYSEHTIKTYCDAVGTFLKFHKTKSLSEISNADLVDFNNDYVHKNQLSASFQNQVINGVKLFFRQIENRALDIELLHRPKRPKLLPNVLSKEEVKAILRAHANIKHKAMLSLIYSCGLRCGELLRLTLNDIDSKRNLLIVRQAKGRKDRIVPLSSMTIALLRDYYIGYRPKHFLFEGQQADSSYDERSLQSVLKQALIKAGINKPVTLHWLRHSYATHLLEAGTDLRYIQEILGHTSSRTTEIYTHVSTKSIQKIVSPFDTL